MSPLLCVGRVHNERNAVTATRFIFLNNLHARKPILAAVGGEPSKSRAGNFRDTPFRTAIFRNKQSIVIHGGVTLTENYCHVVCGTSHDIEDMRESFQVLMG